MLKEFSRKLLINYFTNYFKIKFNKNPILKPLFFTHYITLNCNFNCIYCGFATNRQKINIHNQLNTVNTIKLMEIIRKECPYIYFTGGEPLLRNDIVEILSECKKMGFKSITLNTNMSLIHKKMEILDNLTNLVASFDVLDETMYSKILGVPTATVKQVKKNIIECARLQKEKDFVMTINCVIIPETIQYVREVMDFCFTHNVRFAAVPAELEDGAINYRLQNNKNYQSLIKDIMQSKLKGYPVFGTNEFYNIIYDFKQFCCYPTTTPHIYPNGDLFYPCQPMDKVAANLLNTGSYSKALKIGVEKFGGLPMCKNKCYKACYIEAAIFSQNIILISKEFIRKKDYI
jgi:MoaA/NifB/PqqE/SkfB family radical SAM enzyme